MLARLAEALGKPLAKQETTFTDNGSISTWATTQVGQIQGAGIMSGIGNNTFAPKSDYTREQSILTVLRLYNTVKQSTSPAPGGQAANALTLQAGYEADVSATFGFTPPVGASWNSTDSSVAYVDSKINELKVLYAGRTQIECLNGGTVVYSVILTVEGLVPQNPDPDPQQDQDRQQDRDQQQDVDSDRQQGQGSNSQQDQNQNQDQNQDQDSPLQRLSFDPAPISAEDGYTYYVHKDGKIFARETPSGAYTTWSFPSNPAPCGTPPGFPTES